MKDSEQFGAGVETSQTEANSPSDDLACSLSLPQGSVPLKRFLPERASRSPTRCRFDTDYRMTKREVDGVAWGRRKSPVLRRSRKTKCAWVPPINTLPDSLGWRGDGGVCLKPEFFQNFMSTYRDKLSDPRWQKKRLEILQRDSFTCQECKCTTKELQVHHRSYVKGANPWEYDNDDLVCLCRECHEERTQFDKDLVYALGRMPSNFILALAHGLHSYLGRGDQDDLLRLMMPVLTYSEDPDTKLADILTAFWNRKQNRKKSSTP